MNNITVQELIKKVNIYADWVKKAAVAESFRDLDTAKVEGLKAFNDLAYTVSRSNRPLLEACDERRAELNNAAIVQVHNIVEVTRSKKTGVETPNEVPIEVARSKKTKLSSSCKKSTAKKAKK